MGAHHFKLYVVPPGSRPVRNAEGDYDGFCLLGFNLPADAIQRFRTLLPNPNHWGDVEEYQSSSKWGSDLRIFLEAGKIAEVVLRYAPVGDPIQVLRDFVEIVKEARCELLDPKSGEVLPPDFERIVAALRNHHAFHFLQDPEGAIRDAADETRGKET